MARILKVDIIWPDLNPGRGEQAGVRPVLIISHDVFNQHSGTVIALALTSQPQSAGFPLAFELSKIKLPKRSWVKIGQIRRLSVERLCKKVGSVPASELNQIIEGLNEIVGE